MRRPEHVGVLYLEFDGFFASVAQQADPRLRGKPAGTVPFDTAPTKSMTEIAVSKEANKLGGKKKNVMRVPDVLAICPEIVFVPQRPDLIRRAHLTLLSEIDSEIPIDVVKSIDELACTLDQNTSTNPRGIAGRIKERLRKNVGEPTQRRMYGHGRVLPLEWRNVEKARDCSRLLLVKAALRMRREEFAERQIGLWLNGLKDGWSGASPLESVHDDQAYLTALHLLWVKAERAPFRGYAIMRCGVMLTDLTPLGARQLSLFEGGRHGTPEVGARPGYR